MNDTILSINSINKTFGNVTALKNFNVDINKGEFITILGPSGCGKTTLLRIIAGLETPDTGSIVLDGGNVDNLPPEKRSVNTVFQNYALFPHMNVFDNIAYGLKLRKLSKSEIISKVETVLELVQMNGYEKRKIHQLSGGQKQRVAIARALVLEPKVLLLDEPLGALDHRLRLDMQDELKKMQKSSGTTFVYITHDQDEALNLSDRIILMNNGSIEQIGTPNEIYNFPKNSFVAKFIGESNILKGISVADSKMYKFDLFTSEPYNEKELHVYAVIRPENIILSDSGTVSKVIKQSVKGSVVVTELMLESGTKIVMHGFDTPTFSHGDEVKIAVKNKIHYIYE